MTTGFSNLGHCKLGFLSKYSDTKESKKAKQNNNNRKKKQTSGNLGQEKLNEGNRFYLPPTVRRFWSLVLTKLTDLKKNQYSEDYKRIRIIYLKKCLIHNLKLQDKETRKCDSL